MLQIRQQIEQHTRNFEQSELNTRVNSFITIPIVVHIVNITSCLNSSKETSTPGTLVWNGDLVNIKYSVDVDTDVNFTITDLSGRVVYTNQTAVMACKQTETIDVNQFAEGYYLLIVQTGEERVVKKFVTIK